MTGVPLVQPGVLEVVTDHVNSAWARKVGGILLGRPIDDVTRVDAALPARQTDEYAGEIAFPPPVWEEAYAKLDEHPGATIVGWYHSHPGSGVAMSDYDRRLHKVLFGEPFSVALILDPVAERMAWFGWDIEQLWPLRSDEPAPAAAPVGVAAPGRGRPCQRVREPRLHLALEDRSQPRDPGRDAGLAEGVVDARGHAAARVVHHADGRGGQRRVDHAHPRSREHEAGNQRRPA